MKSTIIGILLALLVSCSAVIAQQPEAPKQEAPVEQPIVPLPEQPSEPQPEEPKGPDVPLLGEPPTEEVDHGCTYTGGILTGSTHTYDWWGEKEHGRPYRFTGMVPSVDEVQCATAPVTILDEQIKSEDVIGTQNRVYWIEYTISINRDLVGRIDIAGMIGRCNRGYRGMAGYKRYLPAGSTRVVKCSHLSDVYHDAPQVLQGLFGAAKVCRIMFLDQLGLNSEYRSGWFNHGEGVCDSMRALDRYPYCDSAWQHPWIRKNGICE